MILESPINSIYAFPDETSILVEPIYHSGSLEAYFQLKSETNNLVFNHQSVLTLANIDPVEVRKILRIGVRIRDNLRVCSFDIPFVPFVLVL